MIKTLLVYAHLISACVAIGILLMQDIALAKWQGRPMDEESNSLLKRNAGIVTYALAILWVTGLAIVVLGQLDNPAYLMNQKLWAKFTVVSVLTINGLFLHFYSFPRLASAGGFIGNKTSHQIFVLITAVISLVSWLYACYLGIARPWNNVASYEYVMSIYGLMIGGVALGALAVWGEMRGRVLLG